MLRNSGLQNWILACALAVLVTAGLFFLMTRLILPAPNRAVGEAADDSIVVRLAEPEPTASAAREFAQLKFTAEDLAVLRRSLGLAGENYDEPLKSSDEPSESDKESSHTKVDWYSLMEQVARDDGDALKRWRLDHGFDKYKSSMQGAPPKSRVPKVGSSSEPNAVGTSYTNVYGDLEVQISENCVAQQPSIQFD